MNLLFLSVTSTLLCVAIAFIFKYLSLLRWISGHAYVLSKRRESFSILELLDLFKNVKPFPISCQKGWKIDSYAHGHRIWFNFLTFPHNLNAPSIKVYAAFDRVKSSSQGFLQVLKDIGQSCEWKPGVISTSHIHTQALAKSSKPHRGIPSMAVQVDCVKEEMLNTGESRFGLQSFDSWYTENVVSTVSVESKRFWHREDNGVCWLLQMNEPLQTCEFYLIQPVQEIDHCLVSIVTWSRKTTRSSVNKASILLSSLEEYIALRRLKKTPLINITLPQDLSDSDIESSDSSPENESMKNSDSPGVILHDSHTSSSIKAAACTDILKYSSILKYRSKSAHFSPLHAANTGSESSSDGHSAEQQPGALKKALQRSVSEGSALKGSQLLADDVEDVGLESKEHIYTEPPSDNVSEADLKLARYRTVSNQCAAEIMAEALRASNIDLELSPDQQAAASGGWQFSAFDKNIVVLKKLPRNSSTVQSYIGKGFVLAPPRTVWDAVRNPRTRFTYDDTLKKVDIIETLDNAMKIVYFYHESLHFLTKENCDMCILHGERQEGDKFILTYFSLEHDKCPSFPHVTRAKVLQSGWIIEPAKQDNQVYSIVTYIMQVDFGDSTDGSENLPFQEMISSAPLSIADLQQYLKPAVQMLRRKSLT
ncbi:hypothetical protein BgiMline_008309 [Biomphalaria glabrata]|uniref:Uncharacterized protein LOC106070473 n=1 Tax=Biomphalaria glabrata TaxID=6526 RepID=A0A9U8EG13_BIOGL|nr:uncharacterized protein LOC106070473 [Biomphalaria glabrata]XP_055880591.1 uncharacterized protein LOC106070473 [Biomphalaria glabrata]XP_055880592.1 uncharacterized protein LOC106070473 [Biomphalaria glabrata]KAI8747155.1 CAunnamed protein product [Biomphalaria glabrata]KAI8788831.1 CAunnamed protein product [Biomphalaria glabrata]